MLRITKLLPTMIVLCIIVASFQSTVHAEGAKYQQQSGDEGLVSFEAENFTNFVQLADTYWDYTYEPENYSGTSGMQTFPAGENRHKVLDDAQSYAPYLEYTVNFVKAEPVYVWGRASHVDGYDDSVWFGLDDELQSDPLSYTSDEQPFANEWYWISHLMSDANARAVLDIPTTGDHIFRMYMREPSFKFDKIVLTTDVDYRPDDDDPMGPPETLSENTGIELSGITSPQEFRLNQNYPNPFNPSTTIGYSLPKSDFVSLKIYNIEGQEIDRIVNSFQNAGTHQIIWTAESVPNGLYYYTLQAGEFSETRKLLLLK